MLQPYPAERQLKGKQGFLRKEPSEVGGVPASWEFISVESLYLKRSFGEIFDIEVSSDGELRIGPRLSGFGLPLAGKAFRPFKIGGSFDRTRGRMLALQPKDLWRRRVVFSVPSQGLCLLIRLDRSLGDVQPSRSVG
ncbi:hypothetical protein PIB30_018752 [Stylosanthes scabra]|uniref:Uncharacterized protein n=1 Tax=Stylosanthes scabra TaxID=79078 RepID=A0ABU6Z8A7_9FABA|nr:hypothetical protein [Stylosanthes scabra]